MLPDENIRRLDVWQAVGGFLLPAIAIADTAELRALGDPLRRAALLH